MARDDNPSHTRLLSEQIDAAYEAYRAGKAFADVALYAAFRAQARNIVWYRFRPDSPDPSLEYEIAGKAMSRLNQFRGDSQLSTWFYRIARNHANDALRERITDRDRRVSVSVTEVDDPDEQAVILVASPQSDDVALDVATLRQGLPPEQAEVLALHAQGYSLEQIAKKTGSPIGTIRSRYRLAKTKMKRKIQKTEPGQ